MSITTRILSNEALSETAFLLRMTREDLDFRAGELVSLRGEGEQAVRDYTVVSGEEDGELEILYRLVPHGVLTPQLIAWEEGREVDLEGPYGTFVVRDPKRPMLFIATGTGIAPARSFLRSHADLQMTVVHGVRVAEDLFFRDEFQSSAFRYVPCVSGEDGTASESCFHGRVTNWLTGQAARELSSFPKDLHVYLCGANEMIYEVTDLLAAHGFGPDQVFSEPYYYRADD